MAFSSVARTYANVNRDAPKSYWDYGIDITYILANNPLSDSLVVQWGYLPLSTIFVSGKEVLMVGIRIITRL